MSGRRWPPTPNPYEGEQLRFSFFTVHDSAVAAPWEAPIDEPAQVTTSQLLATILGPATFSVCRQLLAEQEGLRCMARISPAELRRHGFGRSQITKFVFMFELAKRFGEEEFVPGAPFRGSYDVYAHFRERLADEPHEQFYAVLLD